MSPLPGFDPLGLPAPLWLLFGLKVFGFWVHLFFMNLWFAGLVVGLVLTRLNGPLAEQGRRLVGATPVFVALGVNAGIVPLLFLQVLYPQFFYTATILQAWPWLSVIGLMILGYYGVYVYVLGRKAGRSAWWVAASGWGAAAVFAVLAVVFATQMQLMTAVERWADLAATTAAAGGTVSGTGVAVGAGATQRVLMMLGLALGTTGAYLAFDAAVLRRRTGAAAAVPAARVVLGLAVAGALLFAAAAATYLPAVRPHLAASPLAQAAAGAGPVLTVLGAALFLRRPGRLTAIGLLAVQLLSLLANAIARQLVQATEVARWFDLGAVRVDFQVSPVILFLGTLVVGLAVLTWLITVFVREGGDGAGVAGAPANPAARTEPAVPAGH